MTNLSLNIIKSYGFVESITKPDWDDVLLKITIPNGVELSCLIVCGNEPCEFDTLYGFDSFLEVSTKEQLDELIEKSYKQVVQDVFNANHDDFNIEDWL